MIDAIAVQEMYAARAKGYVLDAMCLESRIIPWGSDCCHGCEMYQCGKSITAWGFCPVRQCNVSPHYFCEKLEQD